MATSARGVLEKILDGSGVAINGPHPWAMQDELSLLTAGAKCSG